MVDEVVVVPFVGTKPKTPRPPVNEPLGELGADVKQRDKSGVDSDCGGRKSI